ncbi:MAG TPA: hypothetical protein ENH23_07345 [candidate division Zixibacteria bacterium]|nr:hypothetical protein [candidate division Zixibacteria bacterium]
MTISEKQLKANRENAKKSTGPKSSQGKIASSGNSRVHGLYTDKLILDSAHLKEDKVEFELLLESLRYELDPHTLSQDYMVQKIAVCYWRSKRVIAAETAHINNQLNTITDNWRYKQLLREVVGNTIGDDNITEIKKDDYIANRIGMNSIANDEFAKLILRYELRLERQLTRCYRLFYQLKEREELLEARKAKEKRKQLLANPAK